MTILRLEESFVHELRYRDLHNLGHGYAFDCDADGHVDLDSLTERQREMYLFVRSLVGRDYAPPVVQLKEHRDAVRDSRRGP